MLIPRLKTHCLILCSIILLSLCFNSVKAQNNIPAIRVTLDAKDLPLSEALSIISQQSGVSFSYNPRRVSGARTINYNCNQKLLSEVLNDLAKQGNFSFQLLEGQIILKPNNQSDPEEIKKVTLSGFIKDASNGEALIGASIIIEELQVGAISNVFGFYSITVPAGNYNIEFSYVGFQKSSKRLALTTSLTEQMSLVPVPSLLQEIVVVGSNANLVNEVQLSKSNIKAKTISEKPSFFGESDAVKALESIPGIKIHSDGSTFYYVRGGDRDQNLIVIDDAPIFNPSHLLGLFSTIIPEAVNDINLYKGSMPASLGGRLSSIMDVRTKKGNDQHFEAGGSVGLLSTKLSVEGPIKKDKSSYLLSGRLSRVKWIFQLANDDIKKFHFYDLTGKLNFDLDEKNKLFFSFYTGSDNFLTSNNGIEWSNRTTTLRWNHIFSKRLFLNTTIAGGVFDYFLHTNIANQTRWNSHLSNVNLKADFSYFKNPKEEITFGIKLGGYNFNPGNISVRNIPIPPVVSVRNSSEFVLYGNHEIRFGNRWGLSYGLRVTNWTNEGESFEFIFDENRFPIDTVFFKKGDKYKRYESAEPRISVSYFINENSSLKASFARNIQNIHLITNSISPFTSFEVWLPSSINIKPQNANQFALGYFKNLPSTGLALEIESFYKKMNNQIDYEAHAETLLNPLLESELRFGEAQAYGVEFQLRKNDGRLRGWIAYSYARAKRKFDEINQGRTFNAFYDRPHQVNFTLSYDINLRWNVGLNWNYTTGAPFSSPVGFYTLNGLEIPVYDQKNNDRLPDYHRLDLSATWLLNRNSERKFKHNLTFSIFNFYGRKNALFINYNKSETSDGNFKIPANLLENKAVATQFYLFQFTPSVSYNFKWR